MLTGLFKGFIRTIFGLTGMLSGVVFSIVFSRPLGLQLGKLLGFTDYFAGKLIAFILIFMVCGFLGYLGGLLMRRLFAVANLGLVDRLLGGALGFCQGGVVAGVILIIVYLVPSARPWLDESRYSKIVVFQTVRLAHELPQDWTDYLSPERWIGASRERILEVLKPDSIPTPEKNGNPDSAEFSNKTEATPVAGKEISKKKLPKK